MDKKGVIGVVVTLLIILAFLAIVLLNFFGEGLLPKIAQASEAIADNVLGGFKKDKFEKSPLEFDKDIEETYQNIISILKSEGNGPCLLTHKSFPDDFKNHKIILSQLDKGTFIQLENPKGQFKSITINDKKPCVVGEGMAAKNFYENYLKNKQCDSNCPNDYTSANLRFESSNRIYVNGKKRDLNDGNLIFKARDGSICFFPTYKPWFNGCNPEEVGLDEGCISIINRLPQCDKGAKPAPKEEFSRLITFLQNLNQETYKSLCREDFIFDTRKLGTGFYILFNNDGQVTLKFNNEGSGNIIETSNMKYTPYEELVGPDELSIYFNDYQSLKHSFIISPAGDYSPSDLADRIVQDSSIIAVAYENKWILTIPNLYVTKIPICKLL